jgi:hypothetical protein
VSRTKLIEQLDREKRFLLSRSEEKHLDDLLHELSSRSGTAIRTSHLLRATILLLHHSRAELASEFEAASPRLQRPPNSERGQLLAFERRVARIVHLALLKVRLVDKPTPAAVTRN